MFGSKLKCFTPLVCLSLALAPGCAKKGAKTRGAKDALAKVPPVKADPLPIPEASPHVDQLGHFVINNLSGVWNQINQDMSESDKFKLPDLRTLLETQLSNTLIPARIMLNQPMGCVVYDPIQYMGADGWPGVCFFSYQGGAKAFIEDLGGQVAPLDPQGHRFHGVLYKKHFYVDELENAVLVSGETSRFAASVDYFKSNIFTTKSSVPGLTLDIYAADIYQRYEPLIQGLMKSALEKKGTSLALLASDEKSLEETTQKILDIIRESEQIRFRFQSGKHRYTVSYSQRVKAHAPAFKQAVEKGYQGAINTDLIARMPKELVMLAATSISPAKAESNSPATLTRWRSLAKALERDEAWAQKMLQYERNLYQHLGDQSAIGMFPNANGPGSLISMVQAAPGVSLQEKWREELSTWNGKTWGEQFDRYASIKFTPKVRTVDGVAIDEFKITAKEEAIKEVKSSMNPDNYDSLMSWLGSMSLVVHMGQVEHIAFAVATTHNAEESSSKAVAALRGVNNFVLDPEFASTAKTFTGNSIAAVLDAGALSRFLQSAQLGLGNQAPRARNGLQDSRFVTRVDPDAGSAMVWSVSNPLIALFRDAAKRSSKPGTMAR